MKILSLGLDNSIIDEQSSLAKRVFNYGSLTEKYIVIVPASQDEEIDLSDKVKIFSVGGGCKISKLIGIYNLAKKILQQEKFDIISVQDIYFLALVATILARQNKIGLEVQVHGLEKFFGIRKILTRFVFHRANSIRTVSQRLKKQLIEKFNLPEEKITVVPIFTEINIKQPIDNDQKDKSKFIFLTVGRLAPIKNISLQTEAMTDIVKKYPQAELWIVGEGPERDNLEAKIEKLKLSDNVKLLGKKNKEELGKIYGQADIFLLTSNSEGWGLSVIEAASYGLPIIMTDVGCAGEVIENNESGLVIPVGDKKALEQSMSKVIENENLRQKLGYGAKKALTRLPSQAETLNLYKQSWQKAINFKN